MIPASGGGWLEHGETELLIPRHVLTNPEEISAGDADTKKSVMFNLTLPKAKDALAAIRNADYQ